MCRLSQTLRAARGGGMSRRDFMRAASLLGLGLAPSATGMSALAAARAVHPKNYFPKSRMPAAVRERLANRLLGRLRITDPAFDDYYAAVAKSLSPGDDFLLVTASAKEVNAFAHFGGLLVMMRGMWEFAHSEDALLGIVAHEMGHVKLDHFESKRKLDKTISAISIPLLIGGLLAGSAEVREAVIVGGSGIITGQIYGHSRELEHEADVVGLRLLQQSGRDGRQVASLLGRLSGAGDEYISTHPAPLRRAAYITDRLVGQQRFASRDSLDFLLLRQKLTILGGIPSSLIKNKKRDLQSAFGARKTALQFGLMLAADSTGDRALADEMSESLSESPHPFVVAARADIASRRNQHRPAEAMLQAARKTHPQSAALAVSLATALRRGGKHKELLMWRKSLPEELQGRADVLLQVSLSASALGDDGEANLLLAESHMHRGDFEKAVRQLNIADKFKMPPKSLSRSSRLRKSADMELAAMSNS